MNPNSIITKLEYFDGTIPTEAILDAVANKDMVIPGLINILQCVVSDSRRVINDESYLGHIYAMFLLAQFRENQALPPLIRFFSMPEDITWELTGEIITEDLGRILASVSSDDIQPIKEMIETETNESLFRAAGIDALLTLVVAGKIDRADIIEYFRSLFRKKLEKRHSLIWDHLVVSSVNLYPEELMEEISETFNQSLANSDFITPAQVDDALSSGKEKVLGWLKENPSYQLIDDAMMEVKKWLPVT